MRDEEATQFVQPESAVDARRGCRELDCGRAGNRDAVALGMVVVEGGEMLLELESRVELCRKIVCKRQNRRVEFGCSRLRCYEPH